MFTAQWEKSGAAPAKAAGAGNGASKQPASASKATTPNTGDATNPAPWVAVMLAAAGALLMGISSRRRRGR